MTDPNIMYPGKDPDFVFPEEGSDKPTDAVQAALDEVEKLIHRAIVAEREACAQVAEAVGNNATYDEAAIREIAAAIRARNDEWTWR